MIARLNEGTRVSLVREPVEGGIWLPTSIRFNGQGRAVLFRKLDIDDIATSAQEDAEGGDDE